MDRYRTELRTLFGQALSPEAAGLPVEEVPSDQLPGAAGELHRELRDRVASCFALRVPALPAETCLLYAEVCVPVVEAPLPLALESAEPRRTRLVTELKHLLLAYLSPLLPGPGGERSPADPA